jgi:cytoskeletal protein CcmA (bactofilin family)
MAFRDRIVSKDSSGNEPTARPMPSKPDYASAVAGIVGQQPVGHPAPAMPSEENRLIVGRNIQLKGEIGACDTLVVEGRVESSMKSRTIQTAESGVFIGEAEVETAEIRGLFEGKLTARKRLIVRAQGRVTGTVRYGTLVIEEGGRVSGDIKDIETNEGQSAAPRGPQAAGTQPIGEVARAAENSQTTGGQAQQAKFAAMS